ncbi:cell cycle histidine kinase CckA [Enterovirga aerilata]|uniref:histidine kinase n=1 Tax=Enterovirga aerilata TaxID=2730920 RepID=A0A849I6I1_9HYPH|nr:PAS domain-containing sensor histidine kinase [Enterovirga sp. DB1703]NNM71647.1 response regulator [Enterovirga sp. DB1703]
MAEYTQVTNGLAIDRSERPGYVGLLLALGAVFVAAFAGLSFVSNEQAQPLILGLLAVLAMIGVFFVFAVAIGTVRFAGAGARNDLTKILADSSADGLLVVEESGRVIYANERYLRLSGAEKGAEVRTVERLFTGGPEISEAVYRLAQAAREQRTATEEVRLSPALGGAREFGWYRLQVRPLPRPGNRVATLWSVADVTQDRERHENVFQELQHAIDYLDHAPAGFLSTDRSGAIVYMNATLAEWLGHDLAKVGSGGLKLPDIMPDAVVAMLISASGPPGEARTETLDLDLRRRQGGTLPVRLYHRVAFGPDGTAGPSRTLVLNRSPGSGLEEGQRAAEVRFARFFNSSPLAIATLDAGFRIVGSNPSFLRLFGERAGPGRGNAASALDLVAPPDRARLEAALAAAASGESRALDVALAREGGRSARLWISAVADGDAAEDERAILYALDTTEQRLLEQQFAQAQKMQAIGQLAGGVAHDFNNVLQAIIGYSDLLLASHRPTDPSFQDLMQIKQNANRAASLVRQLLAFSRRQTLRPELVKLGETLSDLSLLLKRLLGERVQLEMRQGRDLWFVKADVNQLEQVIINLAVNARDAMPDGGTVTIATENVDEAEARRLDLAGMPAADYVRIEVSDTGTGIPPDILDKIFEPFFTTKELGKGTGLGLSTVFGIVKQSGGFIYVDSTVGKGTTFSIYLPRFVPEAEAEAKPDQKEERRAADMTGQGTVLLVEDEDAVRAVNARALSARGYTVLEAASGVEALEIVDAHEGTIDLVVSDVVMPEMDGPTLLGELRKRRPELKVIFVSGYAEDAFAKHLPEGESFSFLAKPFSLKQLVETVKGAVQR